MFPREANQLVSVCGAQTDCFPCPKPACEKKNPFLFILAFELLLSELLLLYLIMTCK